jgi:hypothetical protein
MLVNVMCGLFNGMAELLVCCTLLPLSLSKNNCVVSFKKEKEKIKRTPAWLGPGGGTGWLLSP